MKEAWGNQPSTYSQVQRGWLNNGTTAAVAEGQPHSASESVMMQRWFQEHIRDQPYNNVGAVVATSSTGTTGPAACDSSTEGRTFYGNGRQA
jgi:hypothetical protein